MFNCHIAGLKLWA